MHLTEVENFKFNYLFLEEKFSDKLPVNFLPTVTARSAFYLIIKYLKNKKMITNKNDQILFPQWICTSMSQMTRKHLSPTINPNANVKFAMAYHQYGFPQNMDEVLDYCDRKKIILIEDCANHLLGKYKKKDLGTFGLAGIYSTSKIFPMLWGGGLCTTDEELYNFSKKIQPAIDQGWITYLLMLNRYIANEKIDLKFPIFSDTNLMLYGEAEYAQIAPRRMQNIMHYELESGRYLKRRENYLKVKNYFKKYDFFDGLEDEDVYPYVLPLFSSEKTMNEINGLFRSNNILSGIYNFDINRNVFNPIFKKCLWIPIHQGLEDDLDLIVGLIEQGIK